MFHKNDLFNQTRIDREEGFEGIVLNPLTYCPSGSTVFVMTLENFYTVFRLCASNYEYDFTLLRKLQGYSDMVVETVSVSKCMHHLTEWANLSKENLLKELTDATFDDVTAIKDILEERMTPEEKKWLIIPILENCPRKIKRSRSADR